MIFNSLRYFGNTNKCGVHDPMADSSWNLYVYFNYFCTNSQFSVSALLKASIFLACFVESSLQVFWNAIFCYNKPTIAINYDVHSRESTSLYPNESITFFIKMCQSCWPSFFDKIINCKFKVFHFNNDLSLRFIFIGQDHDQVHVCIHGVPYLEIFQPDNSKIGYRLNSARGYSAIMNHLISFAASRLMFITSVDT